jgi:hypothetical protein
MDNRKTLLYSVIGLVVFLLPYFYVYVVKYQDAVQLSRLYRRYAFMATNLVGFAYPLYKSFKSRRQDEKMWLAYWIFLVPFICYELLDELGLHPLRHYNFFIRFKYLPFYLFAKSAFLSFFIHPQTKGAKWIFERVLSPFLSAFYILTVFIGFMTLILTIFTYAKLEVSHSCVCYVSAIFCNEEPDDFYRVTCGSHYPCNYQNFEPIDSNVNCGPTLDAYKHFLKVYLVSILFSIGNFVLLIYPAFQRKLMKYNQNGVFWITNLILLFPIVYAYFDTVIMKYGRFTLGESAILYVGASYALLLLQYLTNAIALFLWAARNLKTRTD